MPNMTSFEFGQMVLVRFPFTDQRGGKQRPAVVVSSSAYNQARPDIILTAVTSQVVLYSVVTVTYTKLASCYSGG